MIGQFRAFSPRLGSSRIWLGAAGEILIVALGVLLAFGLNAWWVERTVRADEQTHLRALVRDFESNLGVYKELIRRASVSSKKSLELLQLARREPNADPVAVRRLLGDVFSSHRAKPALDAYEALVNSAGLALIRDEELRSALAGFADRATDPYSERFADQAYVEFSRRYVGRLQMAGLVVGDGAEPQPYVELLTDPFFQEQLAIRYVLEGGVVSYYCRQWSDAQRILEQIGIQIEPSSSAEPAVRVEPPACAEADEPAEPAESGVPAQPGAARN